MDQLKFLSKAHEANQGSNRLQISLDLEGFTNALLRHSKDVSSGDPHFSPSIVVHGGVVILPKLPRSSLLIQ